MRYGPDFTPHLPSVWPKSSSLFSRPAARRRVEQSAEAERAVHEETRRIRPAWRILPCKHVVDDRGDRVEVAEEIADAGADTNRGVTFM